MADFGSNFMDAFYAAQNLKLRKQELALQQEEAKRRQALLDLEIKKQGNTDSFAQQLAGMTELYDPSNPLMAANAQSILPTLPDLSKMSDGQFNSFIDAYNQQSIPVVQDAKSGGYVRAPYASVTGAGAESPEGMAWNVMNPQFGAAPLKAAQEQALQASKAADELAQRRAKYEFMASLGDRLSKVAAGVGDLNAPNMSAMSDYIEEERQQIPSKSASNKALGLGIDTDKLSVEKGLASHRLANLPQLLNTQQASMNRGYIDASYMPVPSSPMYNVMNGSIMTPPATTFDQLMSQQLMNKYGGNNMYMSLMLPSGQSVKAPFFMDTGRGSVAGSGGKGGATSSSATPPKGSVSQTKKDITKQDADSQFWNSRLGTVGKTVGYTLDDILGAGAYPMQVLTGGGLTPQPASKVIDKRKEDVYRLWQYLMGVPTN